MNRASQVGNFEACCLKPRPMRVRKVSTSGTKGVVGGTLRSFGCFVSWSGSIAWFHRACAAFNPSVRAGDVVVVQGRAKSPKMGCKRKDLIRAEKMSALSDCSIMSGWHTGSVTPLPIGQRHSS